MTEKEIDWEKELAKAEKVIAAAESHGEVEIPSEQVCTSSNGCSRNAVAVVEYISDAGYTTTCCEDGPDRIFACPNHLVSYNLAQSYFNEACPNNCKLHVKNIKLLRRYDY